MRSSDASSPFRFEARPSRWPAVALAALAVLAPLSLLGSEMPPAMAWPLAGLCAILAVAQARRESRRGAVEIMIAASGETTVDGRPVEAFRAIWRGPVVFLSWRDPQGRRHVRSLWPDVLPPSQRRELRLATRHRDAVADRDPMAP